MTERSTPSRRTFLKAGSAALAAGLAGCASNSPSAEAAKNDNDGVEGGPSGGNETGNSSTSGGNESGNGSDGHGGDGHGSDGHGSVVGQPAESATVTMATTDGGTHFEPHVVRVKPGGTVTWKLESGSHSTTAYHSDNDAPLRMPEEAKPWDSGTLSEAGATFEHTFEIEGVYDYFCIPHQATGMLGTVVVGDPDLDGQPGMQPPQGGLPDAAAEKIEELNAKVREALGSSGSSGESGHDESGGQNESGGHNESGTGGHDETHG